jgi:mannosyltransferase
VVLALVGLTGNDAWTDEAVSVSATVQLPEVLDRTSGTMASYYVVLDRWITVSASLWWLRLLSVVFAAAGVALTGALAMRLRNRQVAMWACLLAGGSFMLVRYAREVRSFAMVVAVVTVAWLVLDRIVEQPRGWRWPAGHAALAVLAPLTHGLAVFPVLVQAAALVVARAPRQVWVRVLPGLGLSVGVVGTLYQAGASEVGAGTPLSAARAQEVALRLVGGLRWPPGWPVDVRWVLGAAAVYGLVLATRRTVRATDVVGRFRAAAPAVWAVGTIGALIALSAVRPNLLERYAIAAVPALAILQADAALHLQAWVRRVLRVPRRWSAVPVVPALVLVVVLFAQVPLHRDYRTPWSDAVVVLEQRARDGDALVVPRPGGRLMLDYAWSRHAGPLPELVPLGPTHPVGRVERYGSRTSLDDMLAAAADHERVWVLRVELSDGDPFYRDARYHPSLAWNFEAVEEHQFPGAALVLMERRS